MTTHDWFENLVGFSERDGYDAVQSRLTVEGDELVSTVNGKRYGIGELTLPTLAELRSLSQTIYRPHGHEQCRQCASRTGFWHYRPRPHILYCMLILFCRHRGSG